MTHILKTVRALVDHKGGTTFSEIAKVSKVDSFKVLQILNKNKRLLLKDSRGKITGDSCRGTLYWELWQSGKFYKFSKINYNTEDCIETANEEAWEMLKQPIWIGGLGDSYKSEYIMLKEENIEKLEKMGIKNIKNEVLDDRLWDESEINEK